jgi:hypothetical protein
MSSRTTAASRDSRRSQRARQGGVQVPAAGSRPRWTSKHTAAAVDDHGTDGDNWSTGLRGTLHRSILPIAMVGFELVQPLDAQWRRSLDAVARARGWPSSGDVGKLAASVAKLSAAYNDPGRARASVREAGAARLGFAFARDVPKAAGAVRELLATGGLRSSGFLRVLDLGSGLGAMTWGLVRALQACGKRGDCGRHMGRLGCGCD